MIKIKLKKIVKNKEQVNIPSYATPGSGAMDLHAYLDKKLVLDPNEVKLINTGISIYIEKKEYAGLILPRSGIGHKKGIVLGNLIGLIDSDYQGEIKISCWNRSSKQYIISPGERIAQMIIIEIKKIQFNIVDNFEETERGIKGFGHTGKS